MSHLAFFPSPIHLPLTPILTTPDTLEYMVSCTCHVAPSYIHFPSPSRRRKARTTIMIPFLLLVPLLALLNFAAALGLPSPLVFAPALDALTIASSSAALPILYDSSDPEAVRIAVTTFAQDVLRVTGVQPEVYADALPDGISAAIIVGTLGSLLLKSVRGAGNAPSEAEDSAQAPLANGKKRELDESDWESFEARIVSQPLKGVKEALVVAGSDRVSSSPAAVTVV